MDKDELAGLGQPLPAPPALLPTLGMLAWGEVPIPGSRPAEAVSSTKHWGIWEVDGLQIGSLRHAPASTCFFSWRGEHAGAVR